MKNRLLTILQLLPPVFSVFLLSAHFLRYGFLPLVIILLLLPLILFVRKPAVAGIFQIILVLGTVEWIRTIIITVNFRNHIQQPWGRYLIIMVFVSLFTFLSALIFFSKTLRARYKLKKGA